MSKRNELTNGLGLIIFLGAIFYVSLWPFEYCTPKGGGGPLATMLGSLYIGPRPRDFVLNIVFYLPFGFFLLGVIKSKVANPILVALLLGVCLSISNEMFQYFVGRHTSAFDVIANTMGAFVGAFVANIFQQRVLPGDK